MSLTLLIDLDNTLLDNDMESFLPAYLQAFSVHLTPYADPQKMVSTLLGAMRRMVENRRPDCTLIEVFNAAFYPALGLDPQELSEVIDRFYTQVFPSLQELTSPRPEAVRLVEEAFERGWRVVVATNPLFPRTAIEQRLEWAGLPPDRYPFDLIATVEGFHFSKPQAAFLAECLGLLGWPDGPVVMVGDSPENDILPARSLGLPAYWVPVEGDPPWPGAQTPPPAGPLSGLVSWIDAQPQESLRPDYTLPGALLAILQSTPAVLDSLLRSQPTGSWTARPGPQEWSPTEVVCHLRDVEQEVNLQRLQKVLRETNPFLPGMDTDPWAEEREYFCQDGPEALTHFMTARLKLLDLLKGLPPEAWDRPARHAILGPTHLRELAGIIANHDRLHVQQVLQTLKPV